MRQCFAGGFLNAEGSEEEEQNDEDVLFDKDDEDEGDQNM